MIVNDDGTQRRTMRLPAPPQPDCQPRSAPQHDASQYSLPFEHATDGANFQSVQTDQRPDRRLRPRRSKSLAGNLSSTGGVMKTQSKQTKAEDEPGVPDAARPISRSKLDQEIKGAAHSESSERQDELSFLRLPEVKAITGLSKISIYELIKEKSFPAPVRLGSRAVAWVRSEVRLWALERVHASRPAA